MKNKVKNVVTLLLFIIGICLMIAGLVWSLIYNFQNPDMTEMRLFLSNPYPSIMALSGLIMTCATKWWLE